MSILRNENKGQRVVVKLFKLLEKLRPRIVMNAKINITDVNAYIKRREDDK
jgi:hypothetical protein